MAKPLIVSSFLAKVEKENVNLPENQYDALQEVANALKNCSGKQEEAIKALKKKFGVMSSGGSNNNKRSHATDSESSGEHESELPHHKRIKLAEEARESPAACSENQKIVDAFIDYGERQLLQGHTGKGVTHLRAARAIRDYDKVIKSGADGRHVGYVGDLMAQQIEQVLANGKITDNDSDMNTSRDYEHNPPQIVQDVRNSPAKKPENQALVDALADFGEHELQYGNTGKGVTHLRAAREIRNSTEVVKSGQQARYTVGFIGDVMVDKIDQILTHGKIMHDDVHSSGSGSGSGSGGGGGMERVRGDPAPIVQDLMEHSAQRHENQQIVDRLREYGDNHLHSGHRGKGISHLRAARSIRDADLVITSGKQAQQIGMVGSRVARKIDQIIHQGHADSDEDYEETGEEGFDEVSDEAEGEEEADMSEFGTAQATGSSKTSPLLADVRSTPAQCPENQPLVDTLAEFGEKQLQGAHTGRGISHLRAAREILKSREVITSGVQAKKIALVGDTVAAFIDSALTKIHAP